MGSSVCGRTEPLPGVGTATAPGGTHLFGGLWSLGIEDPRQNGLSTLLALLARRPGVRWASGSMTQWLNHGMEGCCSGSPPLFCSSIYSECLTL